MTYAYILSYKATSISTHTLTWSVTAKNYQKLSANIISTHTLTWSVTSWINDDHVTIYNFNSHAHVERDYAYSLSYKATNISTHTLTWSVTTPFLDFVGRFSISTHTLTWSVTFR